MTGAAISKARVAAALALMFLLGAVTGAAAWHVIAARMATDMFDAAARGSRHGVFLWSLERKLDLSSAQKARIEEILAGYERDAAAIAPAPDPRVEALREHMRDEIRATLDPGQRARFDELIAELDAVKKRSRPAQASPTTSAR